MEQQNKLLEENRILRQKISQLEMQAKTHQNSFIPKLPIPYQSLDNKGFIINTNTIYQKLLGYREEELSGMAFIDLVYDKQQIQSFKTQFELLKKQGTSTESEIHLRKKDGSIFYALISGIAEYDMHGHFMHSHCTLLDISAGKKAQDALKKYEAYITHSPTMVLVVDQNRRFIFANKSAIKILGYSEKEFKTLSIEDIKPAFEHQKTKAQFKLLLSEGKSKYETVFVSKNGDLINVITDTIKIDDKQYIAFAVDISDRKKAEIDLQRQKEKFEILYQEKEIQNEEFKATNDTLKKTNDALEQSQLVNDLAVANKNIGIWEYIVGQDCFKAEKSLLLMLGHATTHGSNVLNWDNFCTAQAKPQLKKYLENIEEKNQKSLIYEAKTRSGKQLWLAIHAKTLNKNAQEKRIIGTSINITTQFQAEKQAEYNEKRILSILRAAPIGIAVLKDRTFHFINDQLCEMLGYKANELLDKNSRSLFPNELAYRNFRNEEEELLQKRGIAEIKTQLYTKDKKTIKVYTRSVYLNPTDPSLGRTVSVQDITVQEKNLEQIRFNDAVINNSEDQVFYITKEGIITFANSSALKHSGYTAEDLKDEHIQRLNPTYRNAKNWEKKWAELLEKKHMIYYTKHVKKDGSPYPIEVSASYFKTSEHEISVVFVRDISQQKKIKQSLIESEEMFRTYISNAPLSIFITDALGNISYSNPALTLLTSYPDQQLQKMNISDIIWPEDAFDIAKEIYRLKASGKITDYETGIITKDGRRINILLDGVKALQNQLIFYCKDISERKATEVLLARQGSQFKALINALPDLLFIIDRQFIITEYYANDSSTPFPSPSIFMHKHLDSFLPEYLAAKFKKLITQIFNNEKPEPFKYEYVIRGENNFYETRGTSYGDAALIIIRNITDIQRTEMRLFSEHHRLNQVLNAANMSWWDWRISDDHFEFADKMPKMLELSREDIGTTHNEFMQLLHEHDVEKTQLALKKHLDGKEEYYYSEYRLKTSFGDYRWFIDRGQIVERDKNGRASHLIGVIIDVSEMKEYEIELSKFGTAVDQSPNSIIITDLKGNIEYVNKRFCDDTGYSFAEVYGKNPKILKSGKQTNSVYQDLWKTIKSGNIWQGEFLNKKKNGQLYWEMASISPIYNTEGVAINYIAIKEEISGQKIMEENLRKALSRAEQSDKLKSAFLANMSHEIRTPMNAILGFSQLLKESDNDEERDDCIRVINSNGEDLLRLIDDIIDISKIEAGIMRVEECSFNLNELLQEKINTYANHPKIACKKLQIIFQPGLSNDKSQIIADNGRLVQIFTNLMNNAIKFTDEGLIIIRYTLSEDNKFLDFYFKDTGIGISADKQSIIFKRFIQADMESTRKYEGAGLGLSITKAVLKMLGGSIRLESKINEGSTFIVRIPYKASKPIVQKKEAQKPDMPLNLEGHQILIAEDVEDNFHLLYNNLKSFKCSLFWAKNGKEAIDTLRDNKNISLILLDIRMPIMNGIEAAKILKRMRPDIPIIAQTAYAMDGDNQKALDAGCDDYISKPIQMNQLLRKIQVLIKNKHKK